MGELVGAGWRTVISIAGNGGWESIEMVRRYAHLSPNHLSEDAKKIDEMIGINVTNLALLQNEGKTRVR